MGKKTKSADTKTDTGSSADNNFSQSTLNAHVARYKQNRSKSHKDALVKYCMSTGARGYLELGHAYWLGIFNDDPVKVTEYYGKALELAKGNPVLEGEVYYAYGKFEENLAIDAYLLDKTANFEKAQSYYEQAVEHQCPRAAIAFLSMYFSQEHNLEMPDNAIDWWLQKAPETAAKLHFQARYMSQLSDKAVDGSEEKTRYSQLSEQSGLEAVEAYKRQQVPKNRGGLSRIENLDINTEEVYKKQASEFLGDLLFKKGDYTGALEHFQSILPVGSEVDSADYKTFRNLALCYHRLEDYTRAEHYAKKAAERNDFDSLLTLADIYKDYHPKSKVYSQPKANEAYQIAASLGCIPAQEFLATNLEVGNGIVSNPQRALYWLEKSALNTNKHPQGYLPGIVRMAAVFEEGILGQVKDPKAAQEWYEKACQHPDADKNIRYAYRNFLIRQNRTDEADAIADYQGTQYEFDSAKQALESESDDESKEKILNSLKTIWDEAKIPEAAWLLYKYFKEESEVTIENVAEVTGAILDVETRIDIFVQYYNQNYVERDTDDFNHKLEVVLADVLLGELPSLPDIIRKISTSIDREKQTYKLQFLLGYLLYEHSSDGELLTQLIGSELGGEDQFIKDYAQGLLDKSKAISLWGPYVAAMRFATDRTNDNKMSLLSDYVLCAITSLEVDGLALSHAVMTLSLYNQQDKTYRSHYVLGRYYLSKGNDIQKGMQLLEKAALAGLVDASNALVDFYMKHDIAPNDQVLHWVDLKARAADQQAIDYIKEHAVASKYNAQASYYMANLCRYGVRSKDNEGFIVEPDFAKAVEYMKHAATLNHGQANFELACWHENGNERLNIAQDMSAAVEYYTKSANIANIEAFAWLFLHSDHDMVKDNPEAIYAIGSGYATIKKNRQKAKEFLCRAMELGSSKAYDDLKERYGENFGGVDPVNGVKHDIKNTIYKISVKKNKTKADEEELNKLLRTDEGKTCPEAYLFLWEIKSERGDPNAWEDLKRASDLGHPEAMVKWAQNHICSEEVKKTLYCSAVALGNTKAMSKLGDLAMQEKNYIQAVYFYGRALSVHEAIFGPDMAKVTKSEAYVSIAKAYKALGNVKLAQEYLNKVAKVKYNDIQGRQVLMIDKDAYVELSLMILEKDTLTESDLQLLEENYFKILQNDPRLLYLSLLKDKKLLQNPDLSVPGQADLGDKTGANTSEIVTLFERKKYRDAIKKFGKSKSEDMPASDHCVLGQCYEAMGQLKDAYVRYTLSLTLGYGPAALKAALINSNPNSDHYDLKAVQINLHKATLMDHKEAYFYRGKLFQEGIGTSQCKISAKYCFEQIADEHDDAKLMLAKLYLETKEKEDEAKEFLDELAKKNHPGAIGYLYEKKRSEGINFDDKDFRGLSEKARKLGIDAAIFDYNVYQYEKQGQQPSQLKQIGNQQKYPPALLYCVEHSDDLDSLTVLHMLERASSQESQNTPTQTQARKKLFEHYNQPKNTGFNKKDVVTLACQLVRLGDKDAYDYLDKHHSNSVNPEILKAIICYKRYQLQDKSAVLLALKNLFDGRLKDADKVSALCEFADFFDSRDQASMKLLQTLGKLIEQISVQNDHVGNNSYIVGLYHFYYGDKSKGISLIQASSEKYFTPSYHEYVSYMRKVDPHVENYVIKLYSLALEGDQESLKYLEELAIQRKNPKAKNCYAFLLMNGIQVEKNVEQAEQLYLEAANENDPQAVACLLCKYQPSSKDADPEQHLAWMKKAMLELHIDAYYFFRKTENRHHLLSDGSLAYAYALAHYKTTQDSVSTVKWMHVAAELGNATACAWLARSYSQEGNSTTQFQRFSDRACALKYEQFLVSNAMRAKDEDNIEPVLRSLIQKYHFVDAKCQLAMRLFAQNPEKNMEEVITLLSEAVSMPDANADTHHAYAKILFSKDRKDPSISKHMLKSVNMGNLYACSGLGQLYAKADGGCEKDLEKAFYYYHRGYAGTFQRLQSTDLTPIEREKLNEEYGICLNNMGCIYQQLKRFDHALNYFNTAVKNNYAESIVNVVHILIDMGRQDDPQVAKHMRVLKTNNDPRYHFCVGLLADTIEERDEAFRACQENGGEIDEETLKAHTAILKDLPLFKQFETNLSSEDTLTVAKSKLQLYYYYKNGTGCLPNQKQANVYLEESIANDDLNQALLDNYGVIFNDTKQSVIGFDYATRVAQHYNDNAQIEKAIEWYKLSNKFVSTELSIVTNFIEAGEEDKAKQHLDALRNLDVIQNLLAKNDSKNVELTKIKDRRTKELNKLIREVIKHSEQGLVFISSLSDELDVWNTIHLVIEGDKYKNLKVVQTGLGHFVSLYDRSTYEGMQSYNALMKTLKEKEGPEYKSFLNSLDRHNARSNALESEALKALTDIKKAASEEDAAADDIAQKYKDYIDKIRNEQSIITALIKAGEQEAAKNHLDALGVDELKDIRKSLELTSKDARKLALSHHRSINELIASMLCSKEGVEFIGTSIEKLSHENLLILIAAAINYDCPDIAKNKISELINNVDLGTSDGKDSCVENLALLIQRVDGYFAANHQVPNYTVLRDKIAGTPELQKHINAYIESHFAEDWMVINLQKIEGADRGGCDSGLSSMASSTASLPSPVLQGEPLQVSQLPEVEHQTATLSKGK